MSNSNKSRKTIHRRDKGTIGVGDLSGNALRKRQDVQKSYKKKEILTDLKDRFNENSAPPNAGSTGNPNISNKVLRKEKIKLRKYGKAALTSPLRAENFTKKGLKENIDWLKKGVEQTKNDLSPESERRLNRILKDLDTDGAEWSDVAKQLAVLRDNWYQMGVSDRLDILDRFLTTATTNESGNFSDTIL